MMQIYNKKSLKLKSKLYIQYNNEKNYLNLQFVILFIFIFYISLSVFPSIGKAADMSSGGGNEVPSAEYSANLATKYFAEIVFPVGNENSQAYIEKFVGQLNLLLFGNGAKEYASSVIDIYRKIQIVTNIKQVKNTEKSSKNVIIVISSELYRLISGPLNSLFLKSASYSELGTEKILREIKANEGTCLPLVAYAHDDFFKTRISGGFLLIDSRQSKSKITRCISALSLRLFGLRGVTSANSVLNPHSQIEHPSSLDLSILELLYDNGLFPGQSKNGAINFIKNINTRVR